MNWTDIEDIAIALDEKYPQQDPAAVRFTELRKMVESLDEFDADEEHRVNEQILEAIQAGWMEEKADRLADEDGEDSGNAYTPHNPFR
jgi:FeS assembly protein IscX